MYLTDEDMLIWVVDIPKPSQVVVEDAMTGRLDYVDPELLSHWRIVEPDCGA